MRRLLPIFIALAFVAGPAVTAAEAVSVRDLVELNHAGLADDVLIALMDSDSSVFHLNATDIRTLHEQGLSDKVILAMLKTARRFDPPPLSSLTAPIVAPSASAGENVDPNDSSAAGAPDATAGNRTIIVNGEMPPIVINQTVTQTVEVPQAPAAPVYNVPVYLPVFSAASPIHVALPSGVPGQVPIAPRIIPQAPRITPGPIAQPIYIGAKKSGS